VKFAKEIATKSDILVVIGYSVPFFNRAVDRLIFETYINNDREKPRIYFQNPNIDGSFLTAQFKIDEKFITHIQDHNQFFIPHEL